MSAALIAALTAWGGWSALCVAAPDAAPVVAPVDVETDAPPDAETNPAPDQDADADADADADSDSDADADADSDADSDSDADADADSDSDSDADADSDSDALAPPGPAPPEPATPIDALDDESLDPLDADGYDPLRDSPEALVARRWVRVGIALLAVGGTLTVTSVVFATVDPCLPGIGNSCQAAAARRAALAIGLPAAAMVAGGSAALAVGILRKRQLRASVAVGHGGALVGVSGRF